MAYVRRRGKQLAIVHGERNPETQTVEQRILFTIYSKGEALAVLDKSGDGHEGARFRRMLEQQHRDIRFDWKKITGAVKQYMDVLPDLYDYRETRLRGDFQSSLESFTRSLLQADPQSLISAAELIDEHRHELAFVRELVDCRLERRKQERTDWNTDNSFYWRFSMPAQGVPTEAEELASAYFDNGELDKARAVFRLLTKAFHPYAEGHNYLGLIEFQRGRYEEAAREFESTIELGRRLFPKRMSKKNYWADHRTRSFMRGLRNLVLTYNQMGCYDEALGICDRLEKECDDANAAESFRASIYLNLNRWKLAEKSASRLRHIWPEESIIAGFASVEQGEKERARTYFLHATLNHPRAVGMLAGSVGQEEPEGYEAVRDHNAGVELRKSIGAYLSGQSPKSREFFRDFVRSDRVQALTREVHEARNRWSDNRTSSDDRTDFDSMRQMTSWDFAAAQANA